MSSTVVSARTALDEFGTKGEFKRTDAVWRNWIGEGKCVVLGGLLGFALWASHRTAACSSALRRLA